MTRKAVAEKQGCLLKGYVKVPKIQGRIQIGPHVSHQFISAVGTFNFPLDYSHRFVKLTFGEESQLQKVRSKFSQGQLEALQGTSRIKKYELAHKPVRIESIS